MRNFTLGAVLNSILTSGAPRPTTEMTTPAGCVEIASTERKASMSANGKTSRQTERLFVQERFAAKAVEE